MKSLKEFLNAKPLYYDEIDYSRFPRAFEAIKNELEIKPIIHIIGTNGKSSLPPINKWMAQKNTSHNASLKYFFGIYQSLYKLILNKFSYNAKLK